MRKLLKITSVIVLFLNPAILMATEHLSVSDASKTYSLKTDIRQVRVSDERGDEWDGGCYTLSPEVKVKIDGDVSGLSEFRVIVDKSQAMVYSSHGYTLLEFAVIDNDPMFEIKDVLKENETTFPTDIPGCYQLAYCAIDHEGEVVLSGSIVFDSLYDDGQWEEYGEAKVSSGMLSPESEVAHIFTFWRTSTGEESEHVMCNCPLSYPYYAGESWNVKLEYNSRLKKYRIIDPFTSNPELKDYLPDDSELLYSQNDNVSPMREAFIFDRENPSWMLINAENELDAYCEPMRTGMTVFHGTSPKRFIAKRYNEYIGYVRYDVCPVQNIRKNRVYFDMSGEKEEDALIRVDFPAVSGLTGIDKESGADVRYYDIYGRQMPYKPTNQIFIEKSTEGIKKQISR